MKKDIASRMRVIAALRILVYGASFDQFDELREKPEAAAKESFYAFADKVVAVFDEKYLQALTDLDLRQILKIKTDDGFPGFFES